MGESRALAVGMIRVGRHASARERSAERVLLALAVNERGYALIETVELGIGAVADDVTLSILEDLVARHDVQVLALLGPDDDVRLEELVARACLILWYVEDLVVQVRSR